MGNLNVVEIKAFLPAKDFALSKQFYQDLGFSIVWSSEEMAYLRCDKSSFLLNNYYDRAFAENLMMHLQVEDVDAWWQRVTERNLGGKYGQHGVQSQPPEVRPWGMKDFCINDPSGVLWRIGQDVSCNSNS